MFFNSFHKGIKLAAIDCDIEYIEYVYILLSLLVIL